MYLMDKLAEAAHDVRRDRREKDEILGVFADLHDRIAGAPRFLFDAAAIRTAVELTLGRPKVLLDALAYCRIPYPVMWVEWDETGRVKLREAFGNDVSPERPLPDRCGFLLEAAPGGRAGTAVWLWDGKSTTTYPVPNVAPIGPRFDLDGHFPQANERLQGLMRGNLARIWKDNPIQLNALFGIWNTAEHMPWEWGARYLEIIDNDPVVLAHSFADVYGEYIMIWAIMLMLTASRPIIERQPVSLSKLNKRRAMRGEAPRLDHTRVTMRLDREAAEARRRAPLGYSRKSPRVHLVSHYLGRRGDKHWIVEPYWRGSGETISRHVQVRG